MSSAVPLSKLLLLIVMLAAVGQMTQTMYVPSMSLMAGDFGVPSAALQAVMASYLIPYGLSQFIYGPLSDKHGRKPIILSGLTLFLIGTGVTLLTQTYAVFLAGTFIQGAGIGCGGAMARTLTRDCFSGDRLHRANSLVSMGLIFSPLLAPLLGGYLSTVLNWRASYFFLLILACVVYVLMAFSYRETLPKSARTAGKFMARYQYVLSSQRFCGYLLCLITVFSGVSVFEAAAGVLLGDTLKLSPTTVSLLFIAPLPAYLLGSWLSNRIAIWRGYQQSLNFGAAMTILGATCVLLPGLHYGIDVYSLIGGACIYFLGAGVLFPAASTGALAPFPHHAGTAGALLGGVQNLAAGLVTLMASFLSAESQRPLGLLMLAMSVLAALGLIWAYKASEKTEEISAF